MRAFACACARACARNPVLLLALHSSHHPSSGLVSVSGEPRGGGVKSGGTGENERKRRREERRGRGGRGRGGGCLHGQMDCSFSTHVEPCFVFHCRQAGAESIALLARAALSYCTPLSLAQRTHERKHTYSTRARTYARVCTHARHTNTPIFACTHVKVITPAQR